MYDTSGGQFGNINLKTLIMFILSCPAVQLIESNAKEIIVKICTWMFTTALFIIMKKAVNLYIHK